MNLLWNHLCKSFCQVQIEEVHLIVKQVAAIWYDVYESFIVEKTNYLLVLSLL